MSSGLSNGNANATAQVACHDFPAASRNIFLDKILVPVLYGPLAVHAVIRSWETFAHYIVWCMQAIASAGSSNPGSVANALAQAYSSGAHFQQCMHANIVSCLQSIRISDLAA